MATTATCLPSTLPPKSSTAICAATTEPCPPTSEYNPDISVSTPILTTSSEIFIGPCWAIAAGAHAANTAAHDRTQILARFIFPSPNYAIRSDAQILVQQIEAGIQI